jgi:DNA-binding response OmpR family regulator
MSLKLFSIEDNPAEQFFIKYYAEAVAPQCNVRFADTASSALETLCQINEDAKQPLPDQILLDLSLPDGDGLDVLRKIRSLARFTTVPIVILSNSATRGDIFNGVTFRANAFYTKPSTMDEFLSTMEKILHADLPQWQLKAQNEGERKAG